MRHWRTPHRGDRVADELLDVARVAPDHFRGEREVAVHEVLDVFGIARLGQGRETDEIGEEHRDEATLRDRLPWRRRRPVRG